jgi:hypothetical protein
MPRDLPRAHRAPWTHPGTFAILVAFGLSVVVHGATFFAINLPEKVPLLWGLHVAAIAAFGSMILASRGLHSRRTAFALPNWPAWGYLLAIGAFIYAFINFALFLGRMEGGSPEVRDGSYFLSDHGRIIRELTADQYHWLQVYIVRGFSGHWMFFLVLPYLYFRFREPSAQGNG